MIERAVVLAEGATITLTTSPSASGGGARGAVADAEPADEPATIGRTSGATT